MRITDPPRDVEPFRPALQAARAHLIPGGMATSGRGKSTGSGRTRADRLKAALRENLKRRKAQVAARQQGGGQAANSHDSAGFVHEIERDKPNR